ncbi:MAG: Mur ligase family protein [Chloroflexi bacterium]|nr:Mur ligase family protein [Chloroflexota bacterium]
MTAEAHRDHTWPGQPPTNLDPRLGLAIAAGHLAGRLSRGLGRGGGTVLPGLVALRLDPDILAKLVRGLAEGVILVSGTNGKTTTSRALSSILRAAGRTTIHNRAGANLESGLVTALIDHTSPGGRTRGEIALFEVDEAILPRVTPVVQPRVIALTNLFRDQLDRYGEVDFVAGCWRATLADLSPTTTVVLNADDPAVAALGAQCRARVLYYGIEVPGQASRPGPIADSRLCPQCGRPLIYREVHYAHLGRYHCPGGDFNRPALTVAATAITLTGAEGSEIEVSGPFGTRHFSLRLPGLYNVYNALAAITCALALDIPAAAIHDGLTAITAAFGRLERISVGDRTLFIALIKNPVGFTEVLRTILAGPGLRHLIIAINDNLADGTDVSWLWDAEVEALADHCASVIASGTRAGDMAVRLKYAGVPTERIHVEPEIERALDLGLTSLPPGQTLYILPTYTAMLALRTIVARRGYSVPYWET